MDTVEIIWQIDAEISRLQQARVLLSESDSGEVKRKPGRPKGSGVAKTTPAAQPPKAIAHPRRKMSAAGRARIAAAMKARWAKVRLPLRILPSEATARKKKVAIRAGSPKMPFLASSSVSLCLCGEPTAPSQGALQICVTARVGQASACAGLQPRRTVTLLCEAL